jgi:signal transduction histidine kinase
MRMPRPSLRMRGPKREEEAPPVGRIAPEDDARLLRSTRLRLMAVSGAVTLLLLVVFGAAVYTATSNSYRTDSVGRLRSYADLIANGISGAPPPSTPAGNVEPEFGGQFAGLYVVAVSSDGDTYKISRYLPPGVPNAAGVNAVVSGGNDVREVTVNSKLTLRIFTRSESLPGGGKYYIQTATDMTDEVNLLNLLRTVLLAGGALAFLAALGAGYLYAGRALVPIRASIDRRQAALQRQREFTANASHELRTPLTVIRASVEDLRRNSRSRVADVGDALDDMDAEVRHLTALVEDMLLLARTDSGVVQLDRTPLDLADITVEATSTLAALGQERGVSVVADPLPTPVLGDPLRLRQLVTILVDNAIRHSPLGSEVAVRVRASNGAAFLWVEDQGHGIKPEDLPRLFERFWRADNAPVGGTGLGLSIARWIVEQHGGKIGAENRTEGGARFWVQMPLLVPNAQTALGPAAWANPDDVQSAVAAPNSDAARGAAATPGPEAAPPPQWTPGDQDQPSL